MLTVISRNAPNMMAMTVAFALFTERTTASTF
jgi:hypothetical protein